MKTSKARSLLVAGMAIAALAGCANFSLPTRSASFFVSSTNPGRAGDLGGLAGADAHCQKLAETAGLGNRAWRAYLSTQSSGGATPVNARDRIGNGPWVNTKGVVIAHNVAELHGNNSLNKDTGLTEKGELVPMRPGPVNKHDILSGSKPDGTALPPGRDATCSNWTSSSGGGAMVGHVNRTGTNPDPVANASWNSSHITPGCDMAAFEKVGGGGLLYCFASK